MYLIILFSLLKPTKILPRSSSFTFIFSLSFSLSFPFPKNKNENKNSKTKQDAWRERRVTARKREGESKGERVHFVLFNYTWQGVALSVTEVPSNSIFPETFQCLISRKGMIQKLSLTTGYCFRKTLIFLVKCWIYGRICTKVGRVLFPLTSEEWLLICIKHH